MTITGVQRRAVCDTAHQHALDHGADHEAADQRHGEAPASRMPDDLITLEAMKVVIMSMPPWAKLTMRVARQISTRASATAA